MRAGTTLLQIDTGPSTTLRLTEAGVFLPDVDAVFITHHHSDHMLGLPTLLMTRWLEQVGFDPRPPLRIYVPEGMAAEIAAHMLDVWTDEIALRAQHTSRTDSPLPQIHRFAASNSPVAIYETGDCVVKSVAVSHAPVTPAVGYRIDTASASLVVSGDTTICDTLESLCSGADVVVHEAFRTSAVAGLLSDPAAIAAYHSDTVELGAMAARADIGHLVLTHLIPPPDTPSAKEAFIADVRAGGYTGRVTVADDLTTIDTGHDT